MSNCQQTELHFVEVTVTCFYYKAIGVGAKIFWNQQLHGTRVYQLHL